MSNWNLIKCFFGFHEGLWFVPKGTFKSGNEYLCNKDCRHCRLYDSRWLTKIQMDMLNEK